MRVAPTRSNCAISATHFVTYTVVEERHLCFCRLGVITLAELDPSLLGQHPWDWSRIRFAVAEVTVVLCVRQVNPVLWYAIPGEALYVISTCHRGVHRSCERSVP